MITTEEKYSWLPSGVLPEGYVQRSPGHAVKIVRDDHGNIKTRSHIFWCPDCLKIEPAMVIYKDNVWLKAVPDGKGMHCFHCVQKRLGRRITLADLKECPANDSLLLGYEMGQYESNSMR